MRAYFSRDIRRRIAPLVLVIGLAAVGGYASQELPREQEVRFDLTSPYDSAKRINVAYIDGSEPLAGIEFHLADKPRKLLLHKPSLRPGQYDVAITIETADGQIASWSRKLRVPSEGVRFRLSEADER